MTDHDNLRDRITQIFYQVGNGVLVLNMSPNERNELAQAIIDELGLTVETTRTTYPAPGAERFENATVSYDHERREWQAIDEYGADVSAPYNEWINSLPVQSRIVGKWETEQ